MDTVPTADDPEIVRFFGRHLVSLIWTDQPIDERGLPTGDARVFAFSGFLLDIEGAWMIVTAGHILQDLQSNLRRRKVKRLGCSLDDCWGASGHADMAIPFDFEAASKTFMCDRSVGLDVGLVLLGPHYQRLLEANGMVPIRRENWASQHTVEFERYWLLGIPCKNVRALNREGKELRVQRMPCMVPLDRVWEVPDHPEGKIWPHFAARVHPNLSYEEINGMSGGPIFGFARDRDGNARYWIVAVQSSMCDQRHLVCGCPLPDFAERIHQAVVNVDCGVRS